jgi:hypothetical protein
MTLAALLRPEQYQKIQAVRTKLDVDSNAFKYGCKIPKQLQQK